MKEIFVSGGCGFIGSHTCVELLQSGYKVIIMDNLYNSKIDIIDKIGKITNLQENLVFYQKDLLDKQAIDDIFKKHNIYGVIHFCGLKAVGESVKIPLKYYNVNINTTLNLLEVMQKYECYNIIFSSSATVYGNRNPPLDESMQIGIGITNPYGQTKFMIEQILKDLCKSNSKFNVISFRYFNPIGCHPSGLIGEDPNDIPNNLMPYLLKVASGEYEKLSVYGNDYDTIDGTGVRDYIHIVDLAQGHVNGLDKIDSNTGYNVYNLGTGKGTSVLELVNLFMKVNNIKINYDIVGRRDGDLAEIYCIGNKAKKELNWVPKLTIEDMCRDAWKFITTK